MKNQKPVIGLTTVYNGLKKNEYYLSEKYSEFVRSSGGLPVMLPNLDQTEVDQLADMVDGVVLTGGADIPPVVYGKAPTGDFDFAPLSQVQFELRLIRALLERNKPILGVCLGHQLLNVAYGGTLIQDIPAELPGALSHNRGYANGKGGPFRGNRHKVYLTGQSQLREILDAENFYSLSYHHQAVAKVGDGVTVVARASDGVIEATEFPAEQLIISVQWHPEVEQSSVYSQRIFKALIVAASHPVRSRQTVAAIVA